MSEFTSEQIMHGISRALSDGEMEMVANLIALLATVDPQAAEDILAGVMTTPITSLSWLRIAPCGCPDTITAATVVGLDEADAWKRWRRRYGLPSEGYTAELVTTDEACERMRTAHCEQHPLLTKGSR